MILGVTGHRPARLGGYSPTVTTRLHKLARSALSVWQPTCVLTGCALGWDQAVAHAAHALGIPFRAYLPGEWQASQWPPAAQEHYRRLLGLAASVRMCCTGPYDPQALHIRNMCIVDDCEMLLALWDGGRTGGTAECLRYAGDRRPVANLWPAFVSLRDCVNKC